MYRQKENSGKKDVYLILILFETPVANLRPTVKLTKAGFYAAHNIREGVRLTSDAV